MSKLNSGIILEDCLISFLILSTYLLLMSAYMLDVYQLKAEVSAASADVNELRVCMLGECELSHGNSVRASCKTLRIKSQRSEVCVQI